MELSDKKNNQDARIKKIVSELDLKNKFSFSKSAKEPFKIYFQHPDPKVAKRVVTSYLLGVQELSREIQLTPKKEILIIIDKPSLPVEPYTPKWVLSILLVSIASTFGASSFWVLYQIWKDNFASQANA